MRVVGRVTGRGGCRERGREMGDWGRGVDNWGRGVVKVHQRISAVGRGRGREGERGGERRRGEGEGEGRSGTERVWGEGERRGMEEEGHRGRHVVRGTIMEGETP